MTEMPTTLQIPLVFALGAIVGSFLNVVVWRLPRNESVVRPGSHCPSCGNPIPLRWNIPLLSWLLLRGRCRNCEAAISVRYPLVELATALLFVAHPLQTQSVTYIVQRMNSMAATFHLAARQLVAGVRGQARIVDLAD